MSKFLKLGASSVELCSLLVRQIDKEIEAQRANVLRRQNGATDGYSAGDFVHNGKLTALGSEHAQALAFIVVRERLRAAAETRELFDPYELQATRTKPAKSWRAIPNGAFKTLQAARTAARVRTAREWELALQGTQPRPASNEARFYRGEHGWGYVLKGSTTDFEIDAGCATFEVLELTRFEKVVGDAAIVASEISEAAK